MTKLLIIRIKGQVRNHPKISKTLEMLSLQKKFTATIKEDSPTTKGQIKTITPAITWGEASEETTNALQKKYPKQTTYNLNPPKGGLQRKGTKISYKQKGAYGYRGSKINDLAKRMI